jgi:hypothetical protein
MRLLATPTFSEKLALMDDDGRAEVSQVISIIREVDKAALSDQSSGLDVRALDASITTIRKGRYRLYVTFASDAEGEYLLLLDIGVEGVESRHRAGVFAARDPRKNMSFDPNRNMMIDPRRNMMIDPNRNMMIDPRRNMMIDPNRNMMIDPRRNMMIDPNRNMMIDPRRNRFFGGPYFYGVDLSQEGFVVRANEQISLIFDMSARYRGFMVLSDGGAGNLFDLTGAWTGFLVPTQNEVVLRFDTSGRWIGILV